MVCDSVAELGKSFGGQDLRLFQGVQKQAKTPSWSLVVAIKSFKTYEKGFHNSYDCQMKTSIEEY